MSDKSTLRIWWSAGGLTLVALVSMVFFVAGCGEAAEDPADEEDGLELIAIFEPDPPTAGHVDMTIELLVDDEPAEGAQIDVEPWMPAHGHGSSTEAVVHEVGEGLYEVEDLSFSMPGIWEVRIDVAFDDRDWERVIVVEVEG